MSAIDAYGSNQAGADCEARDTTGKSVAIGCNDPDAEPTKSTDSTGAADGCDENYAGACLEASSQDYDCEGGSGDGPDYTGTITVVGADHFGLDRDGDGIGCDT